MFPERYSVSFLQLKRIDTANKRDKLRLLPHKAIAKSFSVIKGYYDVNMELTKLDINTQEPMNGGRKLHKKSCLPFQIFQWALKK